MKTENKKRKLSTKIKWFFLVLILLILVFFAGIIYAKKSSTDETKVTSTLIQNQIQQISELVTTDYSYTKIGKFENSLDLNGWQIPLTQKTFILTYSGNIKLGVNLEKTKVDITKDTIKIELPAVEILENTIDEESIEVYDESNNLFNPIQIEDYKTFALKQKDEAKEEAIENGLYKQAKKKTKKAIRAFISNIQEDYKVEITFKE